MSYELGVKGYELGVKGYELGVKGQEEKLSVESTPKTLKIKERHKDTKTRRFTKQGKRV